MRTIHFVLVAICTLGFEQCSTSVEPTTASNLISNGSFEMNGSASLSGWEIATPDSSTVSFSNDVPPSGGSYSVQLEYKAVHPGDIRTYIPTTPGTHVYRLTVWGKTSVGSFGAGWMLVGLQSADTTIFMDQMSFTDAMWVSKSLIDTLTCNSGDKIGISLRGTSQPQTQGYLTVDLVSLDLLNSLP